MRTSSPTLRKSGEDFILISRKNDPGKVSIVVSKTVAKRAVDRNRIRRIIKDAIRNLNPKQNATIIVKKNIATLKMSQVKQKLQKYLAK